MSTTNASARTWTLRFKHNRTSVLIHVDPLQRWPSIRADLLRALQQTNPEGIFHDSSVPSNPQDILIARPADPNDLSRGWISLEKKQDEFDPAFAAEDVSGKGKGKAVATSASKATKVGGKDSMKDCPQGAGLKDGGVLAFKFRGDEGDKEMNGSVESPDTLAGEEEGEKWDVIVPTLEDTYEDEEGFEEDEGIGMET